MVSELVGRQPEQDQMKRMLDEVARGSGGVVLLAGEAGVGKTRLAEECLAGSQLRVLKAAASEGGGASYGPIVGALRAHLRQVPNALEYCGPIADYLRLLLPELGEPPEQGDQAALRESLLCAFQAIGAGGGAVILLDDLQWADNATLELLTGLSDALVDHPALIIGVYRSDEIPRGHPVRHMRNELRRLRRLREIQVDPLDLKSTAILAERILGGPPSKKLTTTLYERTLGVPLFIEELGNALVETGRLGRGAQGFELASGEQVPIPESVRDAVLLRLDRLGESSRVVLEIAAVMGLRFDLELVAELAGGEEGFHALFEQGLIREEGTGQAAFHHALTREAIYEEITWGRRRSLHQQIAQWLEQRGTPARVLAEHWLAGGQREKARKAFTNAVRSSCAVHAYRDALDAGASALELWPESEQELERLDVMDRLGHCAQLCGLPAEAARAWREVAQGRQAAGDNLGWALAERQLATAYELQGTWERALIARQAAAQAFAVEGEWGDAAAERYAQAAHLSTSGDISTAFELSAEAVEEALRADHAELYWRALALKGNLLAKKGDIDEGRKLVQSALSLALNENRIGPAAEIYQRLASVSEQAADYAAARQAYDNAISYCEQGEQTTLGQVCLACLGIVLRQTGEWNRARSICREIVTSDDAPTPVRAIAACQLGMIHAYRGESVRARAQLMEAAPPARRYELAVIEIEVAWGLAIIASLEGAVSTARDQFDSVVRRWKSTEDRHYVVPALRWGATFFAGEGDEEQANACAEALSRIATETGNQEALAALAHALGESALLGGDASGAAEQFQQAVDLLKKLDVPFELAKSQVRGAVALVAAGDRDEAVSQLVKAYRIARDLGARPLAAEATRHLAAMGERIERWLGRRAAERAKYGGLTRRQMEVLRLVATGMTNKEVAQELFLSPRTVDMHVGNILDRLNSRSRTDAVRKASELGLLES